VRERGETFYLKFLSHLTPRVLTPLTKPKNTGSVFTKCNKAPRRMHISEHPEGCEQIISKDAQIKASRRMHRSKHLEGCTFQSTSKDENKTSRRLHPEGQIEGYAQKGNPKGAIIGLERMLYTLKRLAKVAFRQENKSYNESRPDQHRYSATLHPG